MNYTSSKKLRSIISGFAQHQGRGLIHQIQTFTGSLLVGAYSQEDMDVVPILLKYLKTHV